MIKTNFFFLHSLLVQTEFQGAIKITKWRSIVIIFFFDLLKFIIEFLIFILTSFVRFAS